MSLLLLFGGARDAIRGLLRLRVGDGARYVCRAWDAAVHTSSPASVARFVGTASDAPAYRCTIADRALSTATASDA